MKLFVDAHLFDGFGQGTKTYLSGLYNSVLKRRNDIDFYFAAADTKVLKNEFGTADNIKYLKYTSSNKFFRLGLEIPSLIRNYKLDFAHFQYVSPLLRTCKELVTVHDILFLDFPEYFPISYRLTKNFLFRRSAQRANKVLTVSEYSKDALVRHYNIKPEKIIVTPNGVLEAFFLDSEEPVVQMPPAMPYLLYVSRFEPRKNQHGLLKAWLDLQLWRRGFSLVFVGSPGVHSPDFQKLYASLTEESKKQVFIFKDLTVPELKEFYKRSSLFVYPSFAEGFGIPPLEAAACGANVLCSGTTAMREFSFLGNRLFDPSNSAEFKEKILHYLDHPVNDEDRIAMIEFVRKKYSWDHSADVFISQALGQ